jgi:glycosyltransferase involved in cell wall biosynthesis
MKERPLRIALLNDLLPPDSEGGLELSAFEMGSALAANGHDVQFFTSAWRPSFTGPGTQPDNVHRILHYHSAGNGGGKISAFKSIVSRIDNGLENARLLKKWLSAHEPFDVALIFGILGVGIATGSAFTDCGIPILWSLGDIAIPTHFDLPNRTKVYKLAFRTAGRRGHRAERTVDLSHVLFTSNFLRQQYLAAGIDPTYWAILPRAIDFDFPKREELAKSKPPAMLIACRLSPSRGVDVAIQSAIMLEACEPELDWQLRIAGSGDPSFLRELKNLARPLGSRAVFLGKLTKEHVIAEMKDATIAINPTVEVEGFGRTNIEAMACYTALLATNVPSIHEIARAEESALIVEAGNKAALCEGMRRLLTDEKLLLKLTHAAAKTVSERFTFEPVLEGLEAHLYQTVNDFQVRNPHKCTSD